MQLYGRMDGGTITVTPLILINQQPLDVPGHDTEAPPK